MLLFKLFWLHRLIICQGVEEASLMRFLVARSMNPERAAKMFVEWKKWRAEIAPLGHIEDHEVADQLNARKVYLQGVTESGHSAMVFLARLHFPSKDRLQFKSKSLIASLHSLYT